LEPTDIKTLMILKALAENPIQSQRDLSKRLKISLGLVNAFTKRLARKGYFKIATIPPKRIQYILTPMGLAEKARLTYQYFDYSMRHYKNAITAFRNLYKELVEQEKKRVYFLGLSELSEIAYIALLETNLEFAGIVDDEKAGLGFMGSQVMNSSVLNTIALNESVVITCANSEHFANIMR
jgi:DNA-binding MarR family transcriptional regulator